MTGSKKRLKVTVLDLLRKFFCGQNGGKWVIFGPIISIFEHSVNLFIRVLLNYILLDHTYF